MSTIHRCTDPAATFTMSEDGLVITTGDPDALLIEFRPGVKPSCTVFDLDTGHCVYEDRPLMLAALSQLVQLPQELLRPDEALWDVLNALKERHPQPVQQVDLEQMTNRSRKTIGGLLKTLRRWHLIFRPGGERGGEALTRRGLLLLAGRPPLTDSHFAH